MNLKNINNYKNKYKRINIHIRRPFFVKWSLDNCYNLDISYTDLYYFLVMYYLEHEDPELFRLISKGDFID